VPKDLPASKRRSALELQVRRWAPFKTPRWAELWSDNRASVYAWDQERVIAAIEEQGVDPKDCKIVPETFLRAPADSGFRLVELEEGYEGQIWESGFLALTRWWPTLPPASEFVLLSRIARIQPQPGASFNMRPVDAPFLESSWALKTPVLDEVWGMFDVPKYRATAAVVVAALPVFLLANWVVVSIDARRLNADRAAMLKESAVVRNQRQSTLANLDEIDDLLALEPFPPEADLMMRAAALVHAQHGQILDWTFDNGSLDFSMRSDKDPDVTKLIEVFEQDDLFERVSAKTLPQERTLRLTMKVTPRERHS
jgi:hypothetical protein